MTPEFQTLARPIVITFFASALWMYPVWSAKPSRLLADFEQSRAVIETSGTLCLVIDIYLADTPEQKAQGLMYIEQMDEFEGMLFRQPRSAQVAMWMKNTHIPLDMFFIKDDGSIVNVERQTTPLSTQRISSSGPVIAVLEMNAGFSDRWNIAAGNRILAVN